MHFYVIIPRHNTEVWMPNRESAIGLVNAYHKMGLDDTDYAEVEYDHEVSIPF